VTTETFALADDVAWLDVTGPEVNESDEVVYATALPDGPPMVLKATARLIFAAAAAGGTLEEIVDRVSEESGADRDDLRDDVVAFLAELVSLGLLARR
jgi:hypothetical protein